MNATVRIAAALLICWGAAAQSPEQDQLDFANGLFSRGFFSEALEEYETYLNTYPNGAQARTAWRRLGEAAYADKQYEKALDAFQRLTGPEVPADVRQDALQKKGEVLYYLKKYADAAAALKPLTAANIKPDIRGRALYFSGKAFADAGNATAAIDALKRLAEGFPETELGAFGRYQLAFVYLNQEQYENAAIEFSAVAASKIDANLRMECRFRAAEIYDKIGWFKAAVKAYEELRKEFPDSDYARRAEYGYAWALYHAGNFAESITAGEAFLKAHPESEMRTGVAYLLANCLQQQKQYDAALKRYTDIQKQAPESEFAPRAYYKSAWVYYLKGDLGQAKTMILKFLEDRKESALTGDAGFLLGSILMTEGNYQDAQQEFRLVAEKYPSSEFGVEALYKSAECLGHLGLTSQAAETYETFVKRYPDNPLTEEAVLRAGDARFDAADFKDAVAKYKDILEHPADGVAEEKALYRLALTYHNMRDFANSAKTFQRLTERFPKTPYAAEAHFRVGEFLLREEKNAMEALDAYETSLKLSADGAFSGRAELGMALARFEQKDFPRAAGLFLQVMREHPDTKLNEETYAWTGQYFYDEKKWKEASEAFAALLKAVADYPNPERVRYLIAECAEKAGDTKAALAGYEEVVKAAPTSTKAMEAKFRMAQLAEAAGDKEKAFALYEETAAANVGEVPARARFRLGELYEAEKDYDKAARSFMRVAILFLHEELSPESLWRAGQCYEAANSPDQARKAYEELVTDYPDNEFGKKAKSALDKLKKPGEAEAKHEEAKKG